MFLVSTASLYISVNVRLMLYLNFHIDQEASVEQGIFIAQYNDNNELGPLTKIERKCYLASGYAKQSTQQDAESELPTFREAIVIKLETE